MTATSGCPQCCVAGVEPASNAAASIWRYRRFLMSLDQQQRCYASSAAKCRRINLKGKIFRDRFLSGDDKCELQGKIEGLTYKHPRPQVVDSWSNEQPRNLMHGVHMQSKVNICRDFSSITDPVISQHQQPPPDMHTGVLLQEAIWYINAMYPSLVI